MGKLFISGAEKITLVLRFFHLFTNNVYQIKGRETYKLTGVVRLQKMEVNVGFWKVMEGKVLDFCKPEELFPIIGVTWTKKFVMTLN